MARHYISIDSNNMVIDGFSDYYRRPASSDICINENGRNEFSLFGVTNPAIFHMPGKVSIYIYDKDTNKVTKRPISEIEADCTKAVRDSQKAATIAQFKKTLTDGDYEIIKFAENLIACDSLTDIIAFLKQTKTSLKTVIEERQKVREMINKMEEENNAGES